MRYPTRLGRRRGIGLAAVALLAVLAACQTPTGFDHTPPGGSSAPDGPDGSAAAELAALPVRVEDTGAHYRREDWGQWASGPGGCDTREQVLRRAVEPGTLRLAAGCHVLGGRWTSSYDGEVITRPELVQIDHRVPVKEALQSGARNWTAEQRRHFYNDQHNLAAVSAHSNTSKGDRDPGVWRPENHAVWCDYATRYIATKHSYGLAVDAGERDGLAAMLRTCAGR